MNKQQKEQLRLLKKGGHALNYGLGNYPVSISFSVYKKVPSLDTEVLKTIHRDDYYRLEPKIITVKAGFSNEY